MRFHLVSCIYVLFFASSLGLSRGEMACLFLAIGLVMAAEAFNTALEKLCDFAEKRQNRFIRLVKDMAAGAVLVSAIAAALTGVVVLIRPELWKLLFRIAGAPSLFLLFLGSLVLAAVFVFIGPVRTKAVLGRLFSKGRQK